MAVNGAKFVAGGSPVAPTVENLQASQIPSNTTLLQPGAVAFRLSDAIQENVAIISALTEGSASDITTLQAQVATLQGQVATLQQQAALFQAFQNSFNYLQAEVSTGSIYLDQRTIYRRSFVISSALSTALNVFTYAHGIPAINYIVGVQAMAGINEGQQLPITFLNMATSPNISIGLSCWCDATNIYIAVGATAFPSNYLTIVTLWYTATNR